MARKKLLPPHKRSTVAECDIGDVMRFLPGGALYVKSAIINRGCFGRPVGDDGAEGEFCEIDCLQRVERVRGYR